MLGGDCGRLLHFVVGERAIASGRPKNTDTVDAVLDLVVDCFTERRLIDLFAVGLGGGRHKGENSRPELVLFQHLILPPRQWEISLLNREPGEAGFHEGGPCVVSTRRRAWATEPARGSWLVPVGSDGLRPKLLFIGA